MHSAAVGCGLFLWKNGKPRLAFLLSAKTRPRSGFLALPLAHAHDGPSTAQKYGWQEGDLEMALGLVAQYKINGIHSPTTNRSHQPSCQIKPYIARTQKNKKTGGGLFVSLTPPHLAGRATAQKSGKMGPPEDRPVHHIQKTAPHP